MKPIPLNKLCSGLLPGLIVTYLCFAFKLDAQAACSRPIVVPMAATGSSVIVENDELKGLYPELLRKLGKRSDCELVFSIVPRARQEVMFQNAQADLLIPATRSPQRDQFGTFIPFVYARATLIVYAHEKSSAHSVEELLKLGWKVAVVRGFDYGVAYQSALQQLAQHGNLVQEAEAVDIARMMKAGLIDATIMAPSIFSSVVKGDKRVQDMHKQLHYDALDELPWTESGVYISKKSLNDKDALALREVFEREQKSGAVWAAYQIYYAPDILKVSIRSH